MSSNVRPIRPSTALAIGLAVGAGAFALGSQLPASGIVFAAGAALGVLGSIVIGQIILLRGGSR